MATTPTPTASDAVRPRVTRRRAETRERLLTAAFTVFAQRGFGAVRIEDVCEAAGYTRGAFYSNFAGLDELFFELYERRARAVVAEVAGALGPPDRDVALPTLIDRVVGALVVDRDWLLVSTDFLLHAARHPDVAATLATHRAAMRAALAAVVGPAVDRRTLPRSMRSADGLARALVAVHDGAMTQLLLDPDVRALRRWLRDLLTAVLVHPAAGTDAAP